MSRGNKERPSEVFSIVRKIAGQIDRLAEQYAARPSEDILLKVEALDETARSIMLRRMAIGTPMEKAYDDYCCKMTMRMAEAWGRIMVIRMDIPEAYRSAEII